MSHRLRIATFNLENFDDNLEVPEPLLADRIAVLQPQLQRADADILCLQEVNSQRDPADPDRRTYSALDALLDGTRYQTYHRWTTTLADGVTLRHERNLVTLSRFESEGAAVQVLGEVVPFPLYRRVTEVPPPAAAEEVRWERPLLHVTLRLPQGRILHVVNLHLKSKQPTNIPSQRDSDKWWLWHSSQGWAEGYFLSSMKRMAQALETRMVVDRIFDADPRANVVIAGDFNANPDEVPVLAIRGRTEDTSNPGLGHRELVPLENNIPEPSRYSLYHHGRGEMIDHLLCSREFLAFFKHTEIHNEKLVDESIAFRTDVIYPESDHAPVVAEFHLPE